MDAGALVNAIPDWLTVLLILVGLWQLVPRPIRNSVDVGSFLDWLKPHVQTGVQLFEAFAYRVIVGRPCVSRSAPPYVTNQIEEAPAPEPRTSAYQEKPTELNDITYLATRKTLDGAYKYSANRIAEFIGGTRADVLAQIRAARGEPAPTDSPDAWEPGERPGQLVRKDDPALRYEGPPQPVRQQS